MEKNLMIQGTASSAGKSILVTALGRIYRKRGYRTAPFKSQNMSLNSFITTEGLEMGRAQVVQAEACGIEPLVCMNPILLKPTTDRAAQVILRGKVHENLSAMEYHQFKPKLKEIILEEYEKLQNRYEIIFLEGAGSPAEINLKEEDIVNMGMAEMVDAPVILVADIDRGGVFASIVGTLQLLTPSERERVKGVIINKFRGDAEILKPGLRMLEDIIKKPVLGVIPYFDIQIEDEDSLTNTFNRRTGKNNELNIAVIQLPHISNFTDFNSFALFDDVNLHYVTTPENLDALGTGEPDILILPGSKNTIYDCRFLKKCGWDRKITALHRKEKVIVGICGGYQMLGLGIDDPHGVEGVSQKETGLGLLDISTTLEKEKITTRVTSCITINDGLFEGLNGLPLEGYEIHMGMTIPGEQINEFMKSRSPNTGIVKGNIIGTYIHGIFDNMDFTRKLLNNIRKRKGLEGKDSPQTYREFKESQYNKLAGLVEANMDMEYIDNILSLNPGKKING